MSGKNKQTTLGDVYGQMLNSVKNRVVKESKHPSEDIGEAPLLKGGPQTTAGYMEPELDKKKLSEKELEDNLYNIDELSEEDEQDFQSGYTIEGEVETVWTGDDGEGVDGILNYTATKDPTTGEIDVKLTGGYATGNNPAARVDDSYIGYIISDPQHNREYMEEALEDAKIKFGEKTHPETHKIARESLNNFMKKKSYFDEIYENVFYGGEDESAELDALGIDDGESTEEGDDQVTVTFDRATAQMVCDILQGALGTGEESMDDMEGMDMDAEEDEMSDFGAEEDEEGLAPSQLKPVNFGKDNKVSNVKPVGRTASTKFTDKTGNDGEHGHSLHNAKQPNMGTNNKVSNLKVNQGAFQQ